MGGGRGEPEVNSGANLGEVGGGGGGFGIFSNCFFLLLFVLICYDESISVDVATLEPLRGRVDRIRPLDGHQGPRLRYPTPSIDLETIGEAGRGWKG